MQTDKHEKLFDTGPIRKQLFKLFYFDNKFCLNDQADANEALENTLNLLHAHLVGADLAKTQETTQQCSPTCFVHDNFYIDLDCVTLCKCG